MTNMSTNLKNSHPFLLRPAAKNYLWGGNRLNEEYNKNINLSPLAETWEASTNKDGPSMVASGQLKGKTLIEVLKENPEFLGTHPRTVGELPILIKFIDAKKDLSIQVHPDDEYANKYENGSLGKTEMWYILDAEENSRIVHGFNYDMNKDLIKKSIENKTIEKYLKKVKVKKDDLFYIESGTVHAIGAGNLIAEIQENSNLTYRLYDYDRVDSNGNKRELHIDKALDVMNINSSKEVRQPMRLFQYKNGCSEELLCRCKYFEVRKQIINTEKINKAFKFRTDNNSFHILLCIDGKGTILYDNEKLNFIKGDCIFVPANSTDLEINGVTTILNINC